MSAKTQPTKKAAPAKGGKPAAKTAKKAPAKKAPAKKSAPVKKEKPPVTVSKKGKSVAPKLPPLKSGGNTSGKPSDKPATPKAPKAPKPPAESRKVITGNAAGTLPGDEIQNGVLRPREGTIARQIWDVCDSVRERVLKESNGEQTAPARFQVMEAVQGMGFNHDSVSFQFFKWRSYNGIKGRSVRVFAKRGTFEANTPAPPKAPKAPKAVKEAAAKAPKAPKAPKPPKAPKAPAKGKATPPAPPVPPAPPAPPVIPPPPVLV